ncbi:MAG: hypothetical protein MHM6MM_000020 [Cercozoa sp. M6MM]
MNRNQYDTDVTVFSPAGRLHQLEYTMNAVDKGTAVVGMRSQKIAVLGALRRQNEPLSAHHDKLFAIDSHVCVGIAGLVSDARRLVRHMQESCLNHKYVFGSSMPANRLALEVADDAQELTQSNSGFRPYGVGLLMVSHDKTGPHLHEILPTGDYFEYKAHAFGNRSQAARTYIEKNHETFDEADEDALVKHVLHALKNCTRKGDITPMNVAIAIVGENKQVRILNETELAPFVAAVVGDDEEDEADTDDDESDEEAVQHMQDDDDEDDE